MTTTTGTTTMTMGSQQVPDSLVNKLHNIFSHGLPFVPPFSNTNEFQLVRAVLQMLQGFSTSLFYWDDKGQTFRPKTGVYLTHLSHTSLSGILSQFIYTATSLKLVEIFIDKVDVPRRSPPTLKAFANSVSAWLKRLRHTALQEEEKIVGDQCVGTTPTLLGLSNALSSLCSGAEYLLQVVHGAVPSVNLDCLASIPASEMALNILDHLYNKLNEVCLVQGGEEEAYLMLLFIFVGSALPYVEALDSWLYDGILDDPYEELFFYANNAISISQAEFWQKSCLLRPQCRAVGHGVSLIPSGIDGESMTSGNMSNRDSISSSVGGKDQSNIELGACPSFLKDIAKAIVSAGKSLQLIKHIPKEYIGVRNSYDGHGIDGFVRSEIDSGFGGMHRGRSSGRLTLSEIFCISLAGLIGDGDHISKYFRQDDPSKSRMEKLFELYMKRKNVKEDGDTRIGSVYSEQTLFKLLVEPDLQKGMNGSESSSRGSDCFLEVSEGDRGLSSMDYSPYSRSFCAENPVITVCQALLNKNRASHDKLVVSRNFHLPPLNDKSLCQAIFGEMDGIPSTTKETNYMFGFQFEESQYIRSEDDMKRLEVLFPFPTILPSFQEDLRISELFPLQENSTLTSRVLNWVQSVVPQATPLPAVIMQECLVVYIKKQVNCVGQHILLRLMHGWRLMDELGVLRAIYLLGSGDLLQQFLTVVFNKLDKRESWDDDFELNTVLQESIRNSADNGMLLNAPDSLVVSITNHDSEGYEQHNPAGTLSTSLKGRSQHFGIDALDMLKFTYKVSWPLELIANSEAIKKYNQVMAFLLKVKRAKFVLDKARRWMWKGRGTPTINQKHHWLVEQKLLHFVDAFHQYVMDRVFHNSWLELCEGMALAGSLDEVIEVHEAYLLSIQRQCFVAPDKLWALIASRIKSILGLALDFYSVQQTLSSSGAALAIKARCEMEVDRIEKQFDDCIAFLLRILSFKLNVGHFPHLADLVTRINYNYYYMSDSGNLVTVPGSETAVFKPGKSFPVRSD